MKALRKIPSPARWLILQLARQGEWREKYGGSVGKSGTFPWPVGENCEREGEGEVKGMVLGEMFTPCVLINSELG